MRRTPLFTAALAAGLLAVAGLAAAAFPDKPLRLIVPFPAGGAADVMARGMAQRLGAELHQQVIVDNRGGAGGTSAAESAARAPADGYTLFFGTMGTHAINPALYPKLRYDPLKDFAPISLTHITPRVLVVGPSVPAKNVAELIALARSKPGALSYGSAGNGSSSHLSGALFETMAGVDLLHVPYKGSAPLLVDVLAGRIDMTFDSYTVYEEHIKAGKVRPLGVTSKTRLSALPDVPTIAEAGVSGYDYSTWFGFFAPGTTPPKLVAQVNQVVNKQLAMPDLQSEFRKDGLEPIGSSVEAIRALVNSEIEKWGKVIKAAGIEPN